MDPGFPAGGRRAVEGRPPPMWALFGKNVCENERIGSCWRGGTHRRRPLGSANDVFFMTGGVYLFGALFYLFFASGDQKSGRNREALQVQIQKNRR